MRIACHDSAERKWLIHVVGNPSELRQLLVFPTKHDQKPSQASDQEENRQKRTSLILQNWEDSMVHASYFTFKFILDVHVHVHVHLHRFLTNRRKANLRLVKASEGTFWSIDLKNNRLVKAAMALEWTASYYPPPCLLSLNGEPMIWSGRRVLDFP